MLRHSKPLKSLILGVFYCLKADNKAIFLILNNYMRIIMQKQEMLQKRYIYLQAHLPSAGNIRCLGQLKNNL